MSIYFFSLLCSIISSISLRWKKEDLWELMEKANKLISDAGIPLKVKAEDGGLK